jgi:hypothetical protein
MNGVLPVKCIIIPLFKELAVVMGTSQFNPVEISGSHGNEYKDGCLLGCCAV